MEQTNLTSTYNYDLALLQGSSIPAMNQQAQATQDMTMVQQPSQQQQQVMVQQPIQQQQLIYPVQEPVQQQQLIYPVQEPVQSTATQPQVTSPLTAPTTTYAPARSVLNEPNLLDYTQYQLTSKPKSKASGWE